MEAAFTAVYDKGEWRCDSVPDCPASGPGSTSTATAPLRAWLGSFLASHGARTLVDLGCGDHRALADLPLAPDQRYVGVDCVAPLVAANAAQYGSEQKEFRHADVAHPDYAFPPGDVAILKDVVSHWPNHKLLAVLWRLYTQRPYRHVVLVNCANQATHWQDCAVAGFRPLNAALFPLCIFKPHRAMVYGSKHVYVFTPADVELRVPQPWLCSLHTRPAAEVPSVAVAILVKDKAAVLPFFLANIAALDYPKSRMHVYIRTNNNTDGSAALLADWADAMRPHYAALHYDASDVEQRVERFGDHEWNPERFSVLGAIRQASMAWALAQGCDYYWVQDVDNFVTPHTLMEMVALDLPIVAPLVRIAEDQNRAYANFHGAVDANGYYANHALYFTHFHRQLKAISPQPVVHCTYLVRADAIPKLTYSDDTTHHEYVVFSKSARAAGIPQYLDTRFFWGWLTFLGGDEFDSGCPDCFLHAFYD